jgi:hypothetical protein
MILSHSSIAYVSPSARTTSLPQKTTHRLIELNLSAGHVAQHLLHLGFFRVLEDRLLSQSFLTEGIGSVMGSCHRILQLS